MDDKVYPKNKPKRKASSRRALRDQNNMNNTPNTAAHASTGPPVAGTKTGTFEPSRAAPRPPHRSNSTTEGLRALATRNMSTSSISVNASTNSVPALRRRQSVSVHPSASKSVDNINNHAIYTKSPPPTAYTRPLSPRQLGKLPSKPSLPQLVPNPIGNPLPRPPNFIRPTSATPAPRPAHPPPPTPQHVPFVPRSSSDSSVLPKNWNPYRSMSPDSKRHRPTKIADSGPSTSKVDPPEKSAPTPPTSVASSTHQPRPHAPPEDVTMNLARMILTPPHTQRMVTYPGTSQYSAGGPSACGLTSLNAVRCVLQLEQTIRVGGGQVGSGPVGLSILGTMTKLEFVKDVMGIAPHWRSSEHLEVEDILGLPLFTRSLTCIGTEQRLTNRRNFKEVLSILQTTRTNNSAAAGVLITRPPEIISILHFPASLPAPTPTTFSSAQSTPQPPLSNVFAIFDSHTRPTHPTGSAFVVSASIDQTARYLEKLFAVDPDVLQDGGALLGAFDAHFVVPGDTPPTVSGPGVGLSIRPTDPDVYAANIGMLAAQMELRAARQRAQREVEMVMEQLRRSEGAYLRERRLRESRDAKVRELETRVHELERARRHRREERKGREKEKSARASIATSPVEKSEDPLQASIKGEAPIPIEVKEEAKDDPLTVLTPAEKGTLFDGPEVAEVKEDAPVGLEEPMEELDIATVTQIIEAAKPEPAPRLSTGGAIGFLASFASRSIPFWGSTHQPDPVTIPTPATPAPPPLPEADLPAPEITFHCDICQDTEPEVDVAIIEGCGHRFGRECLKGFVSSKLSDGKFPIVCPTCATGDAGGTIGLVSGWLAESVGISQEEYERWTQLELAAYSFAIECTQCNRSYMVSREDYNDPGSKQFTCAMPDCDHTWCKSCSTSIEKGETHTCDGSAELTRLMEREGWKKCPGCQAPIEKSEGCNHMTCTTPACNTHFCYVCGGKVIQSVIRAEINEAIMQHFSNCKLFDVPDEV
ncbi:putative E3 ubiquitin-protein ligase RNF217 [Rhizoctonia solani]|uniref:Putative E3 ubiquitin-protein ligase RNF217 n=1 Tax=Rhizoctonia solani TaxID=456999 RepID=A0A0K6G6Q9_9AGAM|nr:putative E3 ubiquitin-protein ligase RNF217 [Rhizoctonia solani]